jgi:hypothetical protein
LLDVVFIVRLLGARIFLAHVNHATNLEFCQFGDVAFEGKSPEDHEGVDWVPPVSTVKNTA